MSSRTKTSQGSGQPVPSHRSKSKQAPQHSDRPSSSPRYGREDVLEATTAPTPHWAGSSTPLYSGPPPPAPGYNTYEEVRKATAAPNDRSKSKQTPRHSDPPPRPPRHDPRQDAPSAPRSVPKSSCLDEALSVVIDDRRSRRVWNRTTGPTVHDPKRKYRLWDEIQGDSTGSASLEMDPGHELYRHVNASITFALCLMNFPSSWDCLAEMGSAVLGKRNKQRDMTSSINEFLALLDRDFPSIRLSNRQATNSSYAPPCTKESDEIKKAGWQPHLGGTIVLNRHTVKSVADVAAPIRDDFEITAMVRRHTTDVFRVILGVAIAHSLVHCFMNYLLDGDEPRVTPTDIMSKYGDFGTMWESQVLGGKFVIHRDRDHPLAENQPGDVWLDQLDGYAEQLEILKEVGKQGGTPEVCYYLKPRPDTRDRLDNIRRHYPPMKKTPKHAPADKNRTGKK